MKKIVITTSSFGEYDQRPLRLLNEKDFSVVLNPYKRKLREKEVVELCSDALGMIAGTEPLNADVLHKLSSLKVISRCGVGLDNVDIDAAKHLGIKVCNTPFGPTQAVAELTVGLVLSLIRKIPLMDRELRSGVWKKRMGNLLKGKRVGIIGFGRIGNRVGDLLFSLGCKVSYCDPNVSEAKVQYSRLNLQDLLIQSDIVCIHVSGIKGNGYMLNERELKSMKEGAWLINCARGGVVNEEVLFEHLKEGHLAGVALDVFENEPYSGPLAELDNVILTPHIGSYAREARIEMEIQATKNLLTELGVSISSSTNNYGREK